MSVKIRVQNYNIVKDSTIEVKGLTAVLGESTNGKSSFFNGVKTLAQNTVGNYYIRVGSPATTIAMNFPDSEDTRTVVFNKSTSPLYKLGSVVYDKVGRVVPEDVEKFLNMSPVEVDGAKISLNFIDQFQPPLLKHLSESQLYSLTIKSFEGEKISKAEKKAKADKDAVQSKLELKSLQVDQQRLLINRLEKELLKYSDYLKISSLVTQYRIGLSRYSSVKAFQESYKVLLQSVNNLKSANRSIIDNSWVFEEWPGVQVKKAGVLTVESWLIQRNHVVGNYQVSKSKVDSLNELPSEKETLNYRSTVEVLESIHTAIHTKSNLDAGLQLVTSLLVDLDSILNDSYSGYLDNKTSLACISQYSNDYVRVLERENSVMKLTSLLDEITGEPFLVYKSNLKQKRETAAYLNDLQDIDSQVDDAEELINEFQQADVLIDSLTKLKKIHSDLATMSVYVNQLDLLDTKIQSVNTEVSSTDQEISVLEYNKQNHRCPFCESKLENITDEIMADFIQKLEVLQTKREQYRGQLTQLSKSRDQLFAKIKESGYDPETLDKEAERLSKEIKDFETKAAPIVDKLYEEVEKGNI